MRRKSRLLSPTEVTAIERSLGIDPLIEHRTINLQYDHARWVENLRRMPEWAAWVLGFIALLLSILVFVLGIMTASNLLGGPPGQNSCVGHDGVLQVKVGTDNTDWSGMVVCRDGSSYTN